MWTAMRTAGFAGATAALIFVAGAIAANAQNAGVVEVWKDPFCGCCNKWIEQMKTAGFNLRVHDTKTLGSIKTRLGIPQRLRSCHTAKVGGYVVEGHVPIADVKRLLSQKPEVVGISVPGMPIGSPGMEVPSGETEPYEVLMFDKQAKTSVFAKHNWPRAAGR